MKYFEYYLKGYSEIQNQRKNLDIDYKEKEIAELEKQINDLESTKETIGEKVKQEYQNRNEQTKRYEELAKPVEDQIAYNIIKINEYKDNKENIEKNIEQYKNLAKYKDTIRENARNEKETLIKELEDSTKEIKKIKNEIEEVTRNYRNELEDVLKDSKKYPLHWKEHLENKIEQALLEGNQKIEKLEIEKANKKLEIEKEYLALLKEFGRMDREVKEKQEPEQEPQPQPHPQPQPQQEPQPHPQPQPQSQPQPQPQPHPQPQPQPQQQPQPQPHPQPQPQPQSVQKPVSPIKRSNIEDKSNEKVKITYSAKDDYFKILNVETHFAGNLKRSTMPEVNKEDLAKKLGIDMDILNANADMNIYTALRHYDSIYNTDKTKQYEKIFSTGMGKDERLRRMEDINIDINYDLHGLYEKGKNKEYKYSLEERMSILEDAKRIKNAGLGTVQKGFKVAALEKVDKIQLFIKNLTKIKALPAGVEERVEATKQEKIKKQMTFKEKVKIDKQKYAKKILEKVEKNNPIYYNKGPEVKDVHFKRGQEQEGREPGE